MKLNFPHYDVPAKVFSKYTDGTPLQQLYKVAEAFASNKEHETRLKGYFEKQWLIPSSPIIGNAPTRKSFDGKFTKESFYPEKGSVISCFGFKLDDSLESLIDTATEFKWLSIIGGGCSGDFSSIRPKGEKSAGALLHIKNYDNYVTSYYQSKLRLGAFNAYLNISHPEIIQFIEMRKPTGGDRALKSLNLHHTVIIPNSFYEACAKDEMWDLIDPHTNEVVNTIRARDLEYRLLSMRKERGEPCIFNIDVANDYLNPYQKSLGLTINSSNLCTEITQVTNNERTFVCDLSSVNLYYFDVWKDDELFIRDSIEFLDNTLEYFINTSDPLKYKKAIFSAKQERSIGLCALGLGTYLQYKMIPFESALATSVMHKIWSHIKSKAVEASQELAILRGEPDDLKGSGLRFANLLAIAPNASSSLFLGVSPSVEPLFSNIYQYATDFGDIMIKNKFLENLLESKGINNDQTWSSIVKNNGSILHLDELTEYEKSVFKKFSEIDQHWIVSHALTRQEYVCQGQSINLAFPANVDGEYFHSVHWMGRKLKTLYYARGEQLSNTSANGVNVEFMSYPKSDCLACEA